MPALGDRCPGCGVVCSSPYVEHLNDCRYQGRRALPLSLSSSVAGQETLDRIAFDMYVDVGLSYAEAARQLGVARSTVRGRVRRHSLRRPQQAADVWIKDEGSFAFVGSYTDRGLAWLRSQPAAKWHDDQRVVINGTAQQTIVALAVDAGLRVQWS